jgi:hypothetical protein
MIHESSGRALNNPTPQGSKACAVLLALTYLRERDSKQPTEIGVMAKQVGRAIAFVDASVCPSAGHHLTAEHVYLAYFAWCRRLGHSPLQDGVFRDEFARLARDIQVTNEAKDADRLYRDVEVRPGGV